MERYHHGELKSVLIEKGIEMISKSGIENFSMRKLADRCGVSSGAPFRHFENIDAFMESMAAHIIDNFTIELKKSIFMEVNSHRKLQKIGKAYIHFFIVNPHYFKFLFYYSGIKINLNTLQENDYPPRTIFVECIYDILNQLQVPEKNFDKNIIAIWSLVHGIASLATNENIAYVGNWEEILVNSMLSIDGLGDSENEKT